jgi:hypothetical protein
MVHPLATPPRKPPTVFLPNANYATASRIVKVLIKKRRQVQDLVKIGRFLTDLQAYRGDQVSTDGRVAARAFLRGEKRPRGR